ncbi:hypothetical protein BO86DRAFT_388103 [Aspergillus japonicus CBS 114.51]|uniref:Uncharacterized protein n=2 Tax=Aspergillus TaxID=5052 RepID=A0A2V5HIV6_ASPV1|nr:hypothetical protein BO86DRAFT_388103 [Aspergillus japonicus CBS 114.51]PYI21874.1 hypothetical protein BO99DRAFT_400523 [Aspergillus violaceofuscus CBS 115571]RAH83230.1 hypothetical protein BO86DRAFT_388103 [Aspergillus japonicus CBS 114.51]
MPLTTTTTTTTTTTPSTPLTFYDIATRPPAEKNACSPNPWKTRFALNFKNLPYKTTWVPLPEVASVRKSLNVPACRQFADGSDFYTLPILHDPTTNTLLGDSFDIAAYLQTTYSTAGDGDLFPAQPLDYTFPLDPPPIVPLSECNANNPALAAYARLNVHVDAAFTAHTQLTVQGFPFDPATAATTKAEFVRRAQLAGAPMSSWDDFKCEGEYRQNMIRSFEKTLGAIAALFVQNPEGPFVRGVSACYADFLVGAWLRMFSVMLPEEEWALVKGWHGGVFGRLHDALEVYAEVK